MWIPVDVLLLQPRDQTAHVFRYIHILHSPQTIFVLPLLKCGNQTSWLVILVFAALGTNVFVQMSIAYFFPCCSIHALMGLGSPSCSSVQKVPLSCIPLMIPASQSHCFLKKAFMAFWKKKTHCFLEKKLPSLEVICTAQFIPSNLIWLC